jgi:ribosomal protein S18 acetylase RimI-like enzyme
VIHLVPARTSVQLRDARALFLEYASSLGFDLRFQDFDREVASLPGEYAPPGGVLLLAVADGRAAGCVALRALDGQTCEMKRLYVRPQARGRGVGRLLCDAAIAEAQVRGYARMKLDTVPQMATAIALYRALGFVSAEPYRYNPLPGAMFMELVLESRASEPAPSADEVAP